MTEPPELNVMQEEVLRVMASEPLIEWWSTKDLAWGVGRGVVELHYKWFTSYPNWRRLLAGNKMGPLLSRMAQMGLLIRRDTVGWKKRTKGNRSEWRLGPVTDLLKKRGLL